MSYDAREIFRQAKAFEDAADVLLDSLAGGPVNDATPSSRALNLSQDDLPKCCPFVVLEAFSIELYLKCIATIETGDTPKGNHNLWNYFSGLRPENRRRIEDHYNDEIAATGASPLNIEDALRQSANAFESFRYVYEHLDRGLIYSAGMIATAAKRRILELQPEWAGT